MWSKLSLMFGVVAALGVLTGSAQAVKIENLGPVNPGVRFIDGFETDAVGGLPAAAVGTWEFNFGGTSDDTGTVSEIAVTDAALPGAANGSNYLSFVRSQEPGGSDATSVAVLETPMNLVGLDILHWESMVYVPAGSGAMEESRGRPRRFARLARSGIRQGTDLRDRRYTLLQS